MPAAEVPRPAATVVVARDGELGSLEVLMALRNLQSDFVGGAYVFPGGAVDPDDGAPGVARLSDLTDAEASRRLGLARGGLAFYVACARELFEEAGLLLARRTGGAVLGGGDVDALEDARRALNAGTTTFGELLEREQLVLELDQVCYFAHWITPVGPPRRYDTRFFVVAAPHGQAPRHDDRELVAHTWVTPEGALEAHRAGTMQLILPTIKNLEALARFATTAALLEGARRARAVPAIQPRIVRDGDGVRILLPGDEGFDELADVEIAPTSVGRDEITDASRMP